MTFIYNYKTTIILVIYRLKERIVKLSVLFIYL